ncbi:MAG: GNAT family N-acetyltransferase [Chloroflexi bacterium]|nr:GNAT family N-acetyltransferase [Chloroflexota bacterium]
MNVALREIADADAAWLDTWLGDVAASVGYDAIDVANAAGCLVDRLRGEASLRARIIERDGTAAGVIAYRLRAPSRDASMIELVATPPAEARRGSGMAAAALVERDMREAGANIVYAPAPDRHGIAVYFWIRLGYRPLPSAEWPCVRDGVAWMARKL